MYFYGNETDNCYLKACFWVVTSKRRVTLWLACKIVCRPNKGVSRKLETSYETSTRCTHVIHQLTQTLLQSSKAEQYQLVENRRSKL